MEKRVRRSLKQVGNEDTQRKKAEATQLRREVGWIQNELCRRKSGRKATPRQNRILRRLWKMNGTDSQRGLETLLESKKNFLRVRTTQLRRLRAQARSKAANEQFRRLGPQSLEVLGQRSVPAHHPTKEVITEFWGGILSVRGEFNPDDPAIQHWQEAVGSDSLCEVAVEESMFRAALKKCRSWKAPGRDGICAF